MEGHRSTPGHRQRDFKWLSRGFKNLSREARSLDEILFYPAATKPLTRDIDRSFFHPWTRFEIAAHFRCRVKRDNIVRHSNNTGKMDVQVYPEITILYSRYFLLLYPSWPLQSFYSYRYIENIVVKCNTLCFMFRRI